MWVSFYNNQLIIKATSYRIHNEIFKPRSSCGISYGRDACVYVSFLTTLFKWEKLDPEREPAYSAFAAPFSFFPLYYSFPDLPEQMSQPQEETVGSMCPGSALRQLLCVRQQT